MMTLYQDEGPYRSPQSGCVHVIACCIWLLMSRIRYDSGIGLCERDMDNCEQRSILLTMGVFNRKSSFP